MQIIGRKRPILKHTLGVQSEDHTRLVVEPFDHQNNGAMAVMLYTGAHIINQDTQIAPLNSYVAEAAPGTLDTEAKWRIREIDGTTGAVRLATVPVDLVGPPIVPVAIRGGFDHVWDDRATTVVYT